jgi:hypothetical protein
MILSISFKQEVLALLFIMTISNLIEFFLMRDYGLRARLLAVLFVDHIYVIVAWAFNINYTFFYLYFARIHRILAVSADLVLNLLFLATEASFFVIPWVFPELSQIENEIFQRNRGKDGSHPYERFKGRKGQS